MSRSDQTKRDDEQGAPLLVVSLFVVSVGHAGWSKAMPANSLIGQAS
ncbi:MAG TPA: hypothetical protein VE821_05110 [Pyrinomonadaceae bacterium]|nr:hypothetical protein [Pyrinomonadaceae bacterium]